MRVIPYLALRAIVLIVLLGATPYAFAAQDLDANCSHDSATNTTACTIKSPIVTKEMTAYDGTVHPDIFEVIADCGLFGCSPHRRSSPIILPPIGLVRGDR